MRGEERAPEELAPEGIASARKHALDRRLAWAQDDGVDFPSTFANSLVVLDDASDELAVLAGTPGSAEVARLRLHAAGRLESNGRMKLAHVGWKRAGLSFGLPGLGTGLASMGDLDHDGLPELAVSAPSSHHRHREEHEGSVHLVSWPWGGEPRLVNSIGARDAPAGLVDGCRFGRALCAPGDLDGDGRVELIVARTPDELREHGRRVTSPGSLAVLFLDEGGRVRAWKAIAGRQVGFDAPDDFGGVLAGPGDLDGDGVPDLVLGEPLDCAAGTYRGALRVLLLSSAGTVHGWTRIDAHSAPALALELGDEFGASLAAPGDLDGDGIPDLLVGGARALWSVCLQTDGSVKSARRHELAELFPAAVAPVSLAVSHQDARGTHVLLAATFGSEKPLDVGLARLRVDARGALTAALK